MPVQNGWPFSVWLGLAHQDHNKLSIFLGLRDGLTMGKTQIHWLAPVSMLATLGGAVVLVVGHHLFYQSLDGNPVSSGSVFGSPISKQQANISIGLAFAFVIKASLVFSMSIAFSQLFWREATVSSSPPTLASLDVMYSAFDNIMSLLNIKHLWRYPLLPVVGTTAWYDTTYQSKQTCS